MDDSLKYLCRKNEDGLWEKVNKKTGEIVAREEDPKEHITKYRPEILGEIITRVAEGERITHILKDEHMPQYRTLCKWRNRNADFNNAYEMACKDRGDIYFDRVLTAAENAETKDEVAAATLLANSYKWAAQVSNSKYVVKQKVEAEVGISSIVIDTGIRRVGDSGYNKDEALELNSGEDSGGTGKTGVDDDNSASDSDDGGDSAEIIND